MTTFRRVLLTCPHCNCKMENYGLSSFTVFKSVVFSDGKTDCTPHLPNNEIILICYNCRKPFWKEDALVRNQGQNKADLPGTMDIYDLPFAGKENFSDNLVEYYSELLNSGFCNTVIREIYLRIQIWHLLNDKIRYISDSIIDKLIKGLLNKKSDEASEKAMSEFLEKNQLFNNNLENLIKVYTAETKEEIMQLAEIHRELGDFETAIGLLKEIDSIENKSTYKAILKAVKAKKTLVFRIN